MKRIGIISCFLLVVLGCGGPRHTAITQRLFEISPADAEIGREDYFGFYVTNNSDSVLKISDPSLHPNLMVSITDESNNEPAKRMLITSSLENINSLIKVEPRTSVLLSYRYKLGDLFDVKPQTRYTIRMKYYGIVQIEHKKRTYSKNFVAQVLFK